MMSIFQVHLRYLACCAAPAFAPCPNVRGGGLPARIYRACMIEYQRHSLIRHGERHHTLRPRYACRSYAAHALTLVPHCVSAPPPPPLRNAPRRALRADGGSYAPHSAWMGIVGDGIDIRTRRSCTTRTYARQRTPQHATARCTFIPVGLVTYKEGLCYLLVTLSAWEVARIRAGVGWKTPPALQSSVVVVGSLHHHARAPCTRLPLLHHKT